jgi:hypothetical protein
MSALVIHVGHDYEDTAGLSASPRKRTNGQTFRYVRLVPKADSRTAAKKHRYSVTSSAFAERNVMERGGGTTRVNPL